MSKVNQSVVGVVGFHPLNGAELGKFLPQGTAGHGNTFMQQLHLIPKHCKYSCGACGDTTTGRVLCEVERHDGSIVKWCWCSCDKGEPSVLIEKDGAMIGQIPIAKEFHSEPDWPTGLAQLYDEAAKSYAAGAFTATAMVCRKVLMACACEKGETDGKGFGAYVDHITNNVLTYPAARTSIDAIRTIGNDASHDMSTVNQADAARAMKIVTYMLNTIYSLPKI